MNDKVSALLNDQINKEFYSAYLYLDMANFYARKGLDGFLDWFIKEQGEEEKNSSDLITRMELFGDDARSLYIEL